MTPTEYIVENLSEEDILCQIAEEASELAKAALKRRRAITHTNPTPVTPEASMADIIEEYGDVVNAMGIFLEKTKSEHEPHIDYAIQNAKMVRWAMRLKNHLEGENNAVAD